MSLSRIFQFHGKKQNIRAVAEKSMSPPRMATDIFFKGSPCKWKFKFCWWSF